MRDTCMEITVNEYDALKAVEAAAREHLRKITTQTVTDLLAALAALDAIRKTEAKP